MSHISENIHPAVVEQKRVEVSSEERPDDNWAETLDQIKNIRGEDVEPGPETMVTDIAQRLRADAAQVEAAKTEVNFSERAAALSEKKKGLKEKFEAAVQKALLPVATALAMNVAPALAQESQTDRGAAAPETTLTVKSESRELKKEEVFDVNSPLNITGEKMRGLKREILPQELALVKDFHKKAWQEKNEWIAVSGKDKDGRFLSEVKETGAFGGEFSFDVPGAIERDSALIHTHPVEAGSILGFSPLAMRNGEARPFIMAPSAADIGQCMEDATTDRVERVVDPVGTWEYRCDENHPFVQARKKIAEAFEGVLEEVKARYQVREEDAAQASAALGTTHPAFMIPSFFSELNKKYPGIESDSAAALHELVGKNEELALNFLEFETEGNELSRLSAVIPDVELAEKIQSFIRNAEKKGVYMSYTPFKELPKNKE